jgi:hypothetical protein
MCCCVNTTLPKEEDAMLKISRTKAPQKNLYLKLVGGCEEPWKLGNVKTNSLTPTKWQKKHKLKKHNTIHSLDSKPLMNNHEQITQNMSIEQQVH